MQLQPNFLYQLGQVYSSMANEDMDSDGFFGKLSWKVLAVIGLIAVGILFVSLDRTGDVGPTDEGLNEEGGDDNFSEYASGNESRGSSDVDEAEVVSSVNISEYGLAPTRVEIGIGEAVMWRNTNDFPVYIDFEGVDENIQIDGQGTGRMKFRGMSNYEVKKQSDDSTVGKGFVYVE